VRIVAVLPKFRALDHRWIEYGGERCLLLQDRLGVRREPAIVPWTVAIILSLCDGSHTVEEIQSGLELRTGESMSSYELRRLLSRLDEELILEGDAFNRTHAAELAEYRARPFRPPALAGSVYPSNPAELVTQLDAYGGAPVATSTLRFGDAREVRGIVSPHIDYHRGGHVYSATWTAATAAIQAADVVVVFGTDHIGSAGQITLTRQRYATPWGPMPIALDVVDAVAESIGEDEAFAEELHHRSEHSIELAAVWIHHLSRASPCPIVPILCGSFHPFTSDERDADAEPAFASIVEALRSNLAGRRAVYVAAADLAHVGPVFGDPFPVGQTELEKLEDADTRLMQQVATGDASGFLGAIRADGDRRRICGLPPIYLMLRTLGEASGALIGYDQCPADPAQESVVSIGGMLLW
jgi:MEMO1 family protein